MIVRIQLYFFFVLFLGICQLSFAQLQIGLGNVAANYNDWKPFIVLKARYQLAPKWGFSIEGGRFKDHVVEQPDDAYTPIGYPTNYSLKSDGSLEAIHDFTGYHTHLDAFYILKSTENFHSYVILGASYFSTSLNGERTQTDGQTISFQNINQFWGANLGIGLQYNVISKVAIFSEGKWIGTSDEEEGQLFSFNLGAFYNFGK